MEELKVKFNSLSKVEQLQFVKEIMPNMCKLLAENPQDMMLFCKEMMKDCNMDMSQMMSMMKR